MSHLLPKSSNAPVTDYWEDRGRKSVLHAWKLTGGFQQMLTYLLETGALYVSSRVFTVVNITMHRESHGSERDQRASKSKGEKRDSLDGWWNQDCLKLVLFKDCFISTIKIELFFLETAAAGDLKYHWRLQERISFYVKIVGLVFIFWHLSSFKCQPIAKNSDLCFCLVC